jgi:hypothetical protein
MLTKLHRFIPSCSPDSEQYGKVIRFILKNDLIQYHPQLNRVVMGIVFFIPLSIIAVYESVFKPGCKTWISRWLRGIDEGDPDVPENRDPVMDSDNVAEGEGLVISRVKFSELVSVFPNVQQVSYSLLFGFRSALTQEADNTRYNLQ